MQAVATALTAFSARATRGRRAILVGYSALIAVALLGLSSLISESARAAGDRVDVVALADMFAMIFVGGALFVIGPAMVAAMVAEERRNGTLDLLRTAPLSPTALASGFLVGAPAALYLLCAGPLALHVAAGLLGRYPLPLLFVSLVTVALGALVAMALAIVLSASLGRDGGGASPLVVAGLLAVGALIAVVMASAPDVMGWAFLHPAGALAVLYQSFDGPYREAFSSTWRVEQMRESRVASMLAIAPALTTAAYAGASALLLSAARRLLAGDPPARFTKPVALALFALAALALGVPMRVLIPRDELRDHHVGLLTFALAIPYVACVLGATPTAAARAARRGGRFAAAGDPHLVAALMVAVAWGVLGALYGGGVVHVLRAHDDGTSALALVALALTMPIYALWAATQIHTAAGRMAFWALLVVHGALLVPSIVEVTRVPWREASAQVKHVLAQIDVTFGVALPAFLVWRQRRADRRRAAPAV